MEIPTDLYVQQLINQRNAAANEAALALAQCHHMIAELTRLKMEVESIKADTEMQRLHRSSPEMVVSSECQKNIDYSGAHTSARSNYVSDVEANALSSAEVSPTE